MIKPMLFQKKDSNTKWRVFEKDTTQPASTLCGENRNGLEDELMVYCVAGCRSEKAAGRSFSHIRALVIFCIQRAAPVGGT